MSRFDNEDVEFPDEHRTLVDPSAREEVQAQVRAPSVEVSDEEATRVAEIKKTEAFEQVSEALESTVVVEAPLLSHQEEERPKAKLIVQFGNDKGREFPLLKRSVLVGRALEADIVLNDASVSRKHFQISYKDGKWVIEDLGSVNGTRVGKVAVEGAVVLEDGAVIEAGQTTLVFSTQAEKPAEDRTVCLDEHATVMVEAPQLGELRVRPAAKIEMGLEEPPRKWPIFVAGGVAGLAVVGVLVAHFAFGVFSRADSAGTGKENTAALAKEQARAELANGQQAVQAKDWEKAITAFERALQMDPDLEQAAVALDRAREEKRNSELLAKGLSLLKGGDVEQAVAALGRVPESSMYFAEARAAIQAARDAMVEQVIEKIRGLLRERKKTEAKSLYLALLEERPQDEKVLALRRELEAAGISLEEYTARASPVVSVSQAKQLSGINMSAVFSLYNQGAFAEASARLRQAAVGASKRDAADYLGMATRIDKFAYAYGRGKEALVKNRLEEAERELAEALRLDHEVNDHYQGEIRGLLGQTYRRKAAVAIQNADYQRAADFAKRAMMYNPDDQTARDILGKCAARAQKLVEEAASDIQAGKKEEARDKLTRALGMVPEGHQVAERARALLKQVQ